MKYSSLFYVKRKGVYYPIIIAIISCFVSANGISQTAVEQHGQLSVSGNRIVDQNNDTVQLQGMSFFWSQWMPKYYNYNCTKWLRDDWHCTVVRAAMAVESGGYLTNPAIEERKVDTIVTAAINLGIYVIIDWHDHNAQIHREQAQNFFVKMAKKYGSYSNVIYEPFNEPLDIVSWNDYIKPYHEAVIDSIRRYDPDNLIICGTRTWSQDVDEASQNPINKPNIAYALHYYAATHKQYLRDKATTALNNGVALFVSEFGTCTYTGSGLLDYNETNTWWDFLYENKISWCNWSVADKNETSAALKSNADLNGGWDETVISQSGWFVRARLRGDAFDIPLSNESPEIDRHNGFNIFPNPVTDYLNIQLSDKISQRAVLIIYDNTGRLVIQKEIENGNTLIDLKRYPKGIYLVKLSINNEIFVKKMTLQ